MREKTPCLLWPAKYSLGPAQGSINTYSRRYQQNSASHTAKILSVPELWDMQPEVLSPSWTPAQQQPQASTWDAHRTHGLAQAQGWQSHCSALQQVKAAFSPLLPWSYCSYLISLLSQVSAISQHSTYTAMGPIFSRWGRKVEYLQKMDWLPDRPIQENG